MNRKFLSKSTLHILMKENKEKMFDFVEKGERSPLYIDRNAIDLIFRTKYQSINDLIVFSFNGTASLLSGLLIFEISCGGISILCLFLIIVILISLSLLPNKKTYLPTLPHTN